MLRKCFPFALLAFSLAGCASIPNVAPVAMDNPANPSAAAGRAFPKTDFLNVAAAVQESNPVAVTAGAHLPGAPPSVHAGKNTSPTAAGAMPGMNMPGMKMNMSKNMGGK